MKTALVTGGARRVGRAIAIALGQAGYRVLVGYHASGAEAEALVEQLRAAGGQAEGVRADLACAGAAAELAELAWSRHGPIQLLVNNAALYHPTPLATLTESDWDLMLTTNARAPVMLAVELGRRMQRAGTGAIVNLLDAATHIGRADYAPYQASKAALEAATYSLARGLAPEVRVNAVAPGLVMLPEGHRDHEAERLLKRLPFRRLARAEEVAAAVLFLADGPEYITGVVLPVDGGRRLV